MFCLRLANKSTWSNRLGLNLLQFSLFLADSFCWRILLCDCRRLLLNKQLASVFSPHDYYVWIVEGLTWNVLGDFIFGCRFVCRFYGIEFVIFSFEAVHLNNINCACIVSEIMNHLVCFLTKMTESESGDEATVLSVFVASEMNFWYLSFCFVVNWSWHNRKIFFALWFLHVDIFSFGVHVSYECMTCVRLVSFSWLKKSI